MVYTSRSTRPESVEIKLTLSGHLFSDRRSQKKKKTQRIKEKCTKERVLHSSHHLRLFDLNAMTPKESKARPC